jgi:hypothetical protein
MYQNPFGSIFGEGPLPKQEAPELEESKPTAEEANEKLLAAREAVRYEELRAPKVPFSREESQFKAASTVVSTDPKVLLAQADLSVDKSQIKYATLARKLKELEDKNSAAEVYLTILKEISGLSTDKQKEIEKFIAANETKLKNIAISERVVSSSKNIKEATAALDTEIKHWELLNKEKGRVDLKSFRPTKFKVSEELPIIKILPKIGGASASDKIVRLDDHGIMKSTGYGETPVKVDEVISGKPKDQEYYIKYMSKLPNQAYFVDQRNKYFKTGSLEKKAEKNVLLAQQYDWKALQLTKDIEAATAKFEKLQAEIAKASQALNQKILTGLSVVVKAKPALFRTGMLLDNLRSSISTSSTLSGLGADLPALVAAGKQEIQTREKVLTDLQTKVITESPAHAVAPVAKQKSSLMILAGIVVLLLLLRSK